MTHNGSNDGLEALGQKHNTNNFLKKTALRNLWAIALSLALVLTLVLSNPVYASSYDQIASQLLEKCREEGILPEDCSEKEILRKTSSGQLPLSEEERQKMEEQQKQINGSMYMIGIGAAIAGTVAFFSLRRLNNQRHEI